MDKKQDKKLLELMERQAEALEKIAKATEEVGQKLDLFITLWSEDDTRDLPF